MDGKEDDIFLCICMRKILQFSVLLFQQIIVSLLLKKVSSHSPYTGFPQSNPGLRVFPKAHESPYVESFPCSVFHHCSCHASKSTGLIPVEGIEEGDGRTELGRMLGLECELRAQALLPVTGPWAPA